MANKFADLRAKMSPESRERAHAKAVVYKERSAMSYPTLTPEQRKQGNIPFREMPQGERIALNVLAAFFGSRMGCDDLTAYRKRYLENNRLQLSQDVIDSALAHYDAFEEILNTGVKEAVTKLMETIKPPTDSLQ